MLQSPALSHEEGSTLFDAFSRQHQSYRPRDTLRAWNSFRSGGIGFGTLIHFARRAVLETGSGRFNDDPVSPQTPICIIAPDATVARVAMQAVATTHALVVPDLDPLLARVVKLPEAASRIVIVHRGTAPQREPVPPRWRYQPVTSALWRALYMDGPSLAMTLASESAPRLDVLAARAVDLACGGNIRAIGLIAERIEGRVGMRPDEVAPEDEARREDMQTVIESIVTAMVNAKIASADDSPEDSAPDRTPVVING